jgi:hypothetical protein
MHPQTSVYSNQTTRRYVPDGSNLHIRHRENLTSHIIKYLSSPTTHHGGTGGREGLSYGWSRLVSHCHASPTLFIVC